MIGIYGIYNIETDKWYIGQSVDIHKRWKHHKWALLNGYHYNAKLTRSWNLYGEHSFEFIVLEECTKELLNEREQFWIKYYNSIDNGYNLCEGGNTPKGRIVSDELKERMSILRSGESNPFYGKHHTDQCRHMISTRQMGSKNHMFGKFAENHPRSRQVLCVDTGTVYYGLAEASRKTNVDRCNISACCSGRLKTAGGFHWKYVD